MDDKYYRKHNNYLPQVQHNNNKRYIRAQNPSFSSTLLDQIYRSIDDTSDHHHDVDDELVFYKGNLMTVKQKQYIHTTSAAAQADFQQIQNWMEKSKGSGAKVTKTSSEKSAATHHHTYQRKFDDNFVNSTSSWSSSSDSISTSGGLFSSEAESNYGLSSTTTHTPKPIKTSSTDIKKIILRDEVPNHESGGVVKRSKLKALKMLNKARQPISPGAKLANFVNSLFTSTGSGGGNAKKGKTSASADSTSRSCLSKSPGNLSNKNIIIGTKRSVRFYPVSVIVDEDCQPCGHKSLQHGHGHGINKNIADTDHKTYNINEELVYRKDQRVEEAARELLKNHQSKIECGTELEEDDDDDASYASSDLFELDNLNNNGTDVLGNYMKELPVYETTYLDTNPPITNTTLVV